MKTTIYPYVDLCINTDVTKVEVLDCKEFISPIATKVKILLALLRDKEQGDSYFLIRQDDEQGIDDLFVEVDFMESVPEDWFLYRFQS